jgi:transcriptional/translational regulatory protein YebC/TACO1
MGKGEGEELVELLIEAFGPEGVMLMIEVVTDNRNRSVAELRNLIEKHGGRMGEPGSVAYAYERKDGEWVAKFVMSVSDQAKFEEFIEAVGEHEDVQEVYANVG